MQDYIGSFNTELWDKMKALASLNGEKMEDYINRVIEENLNTLNAKSYNEGENYKRKRVLLDEKTHQKVKTEAYMQECTMRDIIQSIIEKEIEKAGL